MLSTLRKEMRSLASKKKVELYQRFFKTGKGEYGEGDIFIGLTVPESRSVAKKYSDLSFGDIATFLKSKIHEERLVALLILVHNYQSGKEKEKIYKFYLKNTKYVNNWDLVDLTAYNIVGDYLLNNTAEKKILYKLVKSNSLWERRISIIATFQFIKNNRFDDTLKIARLLLKDKHDLIHKAVGWMLRELGKKDQAVEEEFLKKHYKEMPRTALRYSIERFSDSKKKFYMKK
jgi:3-methyladenine DNA glycosylase AlkD